MINNVISFPQVPEVTYVKPTPDVPHDIQAASASGQAKNQTDHSDLSHSQDKGPPPEYSLRLTVDKDPKTGDWVYKAIDRYTGEVVRQLPRQELLDMRKSANYHAGSVIKTDI